MKNADSEWKYFKWIRIVKMMFWILFGACFAAVFCLQPYMGNDKQTYTPEKLRTLTGWRLVTDEGFEPIELPKRVKTGKGTSVFIENTLPDSVSEEERLYICGFHEDMVVRIDGIVRADYDFRNSRLFGTATPSYYLFVDLEPEDAGKTIEIEFYSGMLIPNYIVNEVFYGTGISFFDYIVKSNSKMLFIAAMLIVIGLCFIFFSVVTNVTFGKKQGFHYLGAFPMMIGLIIFTGSYIRQFYIENLTMLTFLTYAGIDLCAIPLLCFLDELQQYRFKKQYLFIKVVYLLSFIIALFLHIFRIVDFASSVYLFHIYMVLSIIVVLSLFIVDLRRKFQPDILETFLALLVLSCFLLLEIFRLDIRGESLWGFYIIVGVLLFLVFMTFTTMRQIQRREYEKYKLLEASETKNIFFANVSHEIRTPLNVMLGMNEMILRESNTEELKSYAENIQESGRSLLALINDILDISKLESGKMEITNQEFELRNLLDSLYYIGKESALKNGNQYRIEVDQKIPAKVIADEQHIRQILINLLSNAMKYTNSGEVVLTVRMKNASAKSDVIIFSVRDTGIGIKPDDMRYLFQDFKRFDVEKNRNVEGTGLGLSISKELAELMHGRIIVKSEYGIGSEFSVVIPIEFLPAEEIGVYEPGNRNGRQNKVEHGFIAPMARILVVDDSSMNVDVIKSLLRRTGIEIDEAFSGRECLDKLTQKKYHVVLLDQMMPDMDGIETLKNAGSLPYNMNSDTPFIAVTANAVAGAKEMLLHSGFSDYISKPISWEELEQALLRHLPEELVIRSIFDIQKSDFEQEKVEQFSELLRRYDISLEEALRYTGGDLYQYAKFMELYYQSYEKIKDELEKHLSMESIDYYTVKVHALKGNAKSLGALDLFYTSQRMEKRAKQGDIEYLIHTQPLLLMEMKRAYDGAIAFLDYSGLWESDRLLKEDKKLLLTDEQLQQFYTRMEDCIDGLQSGEAIHMIKELRKYQTNDEMEEFLKQLEGLLVDMEYDMAGELLRKRKK